MSNNWFRFKKFTIEQAKTAMKVSTDACIQGAWLAQCCKQLNAYTVLDIGTGTGLLSLMLAQEIKYTNITAIELDEAAATEADFNFAQSSFPNLKALNISLQAFLHCKEEWSRFSLIVCNPPFFHQHLKALVAERNAARHSDTLSKTDLADCVSSLLADDGVFCVLYPQSEWEAWLKVALSKGLHLQSVLFIYPNKNKPCNRVVGIFSKFLNIEPLTEHLIIYEAPGNYTAEFRALLSPYYLHL